jgi:hypothetical protein
MTVSLATLCIPIPTERRCSKLKQQKKKQRYMQRCSRILVVVVLFAVALLLFLFRTLSLSLSLFLPSFASSFSHFPVNLLIHVRGAGGQKKGWQTKNQQKFTII